MNKNKFILTLFILFISISGANAMDFYPEMGIDPFYSSLNPTYTDNEEFKDNSTVVNMIKNRKKNKKENKDNNDLIEKYNADVVEVKDTKVEVKDNSIEDGNQENVIKRFLKLNKKSDDTENKQEIETPKRRPTVRELEAEQKERERIKNNEETFKQKFSSFIHPKKKKAQKEAEVVSDPDIEFLADHMEYYPDRFEVEAVGNAKIIFVKEDTKLSANKIIFNYDKNIITANENVVLTAKDSITEGDFLRLDLSKPDGWVENPVTSTQDVVLTAKEAFLYSDRIEEYDGVAKILKNEVLNYRANSFASYVDKGGVFTTNKKLQKPTTGIYSLKAKTIYIDSKQDHDVITIKNADLYLKNHKIASIPTSKIVSNKENTVVESNLPEFGSQSGLGMHFGPAVVLNVPGGATLKLAPILTYGDDRLGVGGIARFRNAHNMTEVAYSTSEENLLIRGKHKIAPGLTLNYSRLTNQNEWFLGYRRPKYSASLNYSRSDYVKDLKLRFSQLYSAGYYLDDVRNVKSRDAKGRFRWMTQTYKPIYSYNNSEGNVSFSTGIVAQTSASVYTSGEVVGLFRMGPVISTNVGPWRQAAIYYITGKAGDSPFDFDRYRYGRSNVVLIESLDICKYLSVGYLASLSMNRDNKRDDLFQENKFLVSVGPEYIKFTLGYDAYRHNTSFLVSMLVGSKDSEVAFKKTIINNPDTLGKTNKKKKTKKTNYKRFLKEKITPDTVI